ncbi:uncharacterized protein TNCV_1665801 [Trichonephila clavipes]|nr:uncharacterized protein TNCV_1665801 [Trichonephila clavipes]
MLLRIQQSCSRLPKSFSDSSMSGPLPDLSPVEHVWNQLKRQMPSCHSVHDLEFAVQDFEGRIGAFTTGSPHTNTIVITAQIESGFVAKDDQVPFRCSPVSSCVLPLQMVESMGGHQGESTRNGCPDPKCPSARHLRMVREDPWVPGEGATCAWIAADEAVGCTRAFVMMWETSR